MEKLLKERTLSFEADIISIARLHVEATDENIINTYNKHFIKKVRKLREVHFETLSYWSNNLLRKLKKRKNKRDSISNFVFKTQHTNFYKELVKNKGFYFAMFVYLMTEIRSAKI